MLFPTPDHNSQELANTRHELRGLPTYIVLAGGPQAALIERMRFAYCFIQGKVIEVGVFVVIVIVVII